MKFYSRNKQLVKKLSAGNLSAFSELYVLHRIRVFNFIFRHLNDREDAEEVMQDVFVKIWQNRNQINSIRLMLVCQDPTLHYLPFLFFTGIVIIFFK